MKKFILGGLVLIIIIGVSYWLFNNDNDDRIIEDNNIAIEDDQEIEKYPKDVDFCRAMEEKLDQNKCFNTLAQYDGNLSICDEIDNLTEQENCYLDLVKNYYINGLELQGGQNTHFYSPVLSELVCRVITTTDIKDDCYLLMSKEEGRDAYCWPIEDKTKQNKCYFDLEIDGEAAIEQELGIKLSLSNNFIKTFGAPTHSYIHEGSLGKFVNFNFTFSEKNYARSQFRLRGYTPDYKSNLTAPSTSNWTGKDDILESCTTSTELEYRYCKLLEIDGEEAILETSYINYEGIGDVWVNVYFNSLGDYKYRGLNFSLFLADVNKNVGEFYYDKAPTDSDKPMSRFYTQSQNILQNKNLSEKDQEKLDLFNEMLESLEFIK
jgi:hypothetical protein